MLSINATCVVLKHSESFRKTLVLKHYFNAVPNPPCEFICKSIVKYSIISCCNFRVAVWRVYQCGVCIPVLEVNGSRSCDTANQTIDLVVRLEQELCFKGAVNWGVTLRIIPHSSDMFYCVDLLAICFTVS